MDENLIILLLLFLDIKTKHQHLKYHLNNNLGEYSEREYCYKLECLNEWWAVEQYITDSSVNTVTSISYFITIS